MAYALISEQESDVGEPSSYSEAISSTQRSEWLQAMKAEMGSLMKNQTWVLVQRPIDQGLIGCRWVFKEDGIKRVEFYTGLRPD